MICLEIYTMFIPPSQETTGSFGNVAQTIIKVIPQRMVVA